MERHRIGDRVQNCALGVFLLLLAVTAAMGLPQADPEIRPAARPLYWWLGVRPGLGFIAGGETEGLVLACLDLTVQSGKIFVSLRGIAGANPSDDRTSVGEVDLLFGYFHRKEKSAWSYGLGIGYIDTYPPAKPPSKGLSVPLEVRYAWLFSRSAAVTASGLLSIHGGAIYAGITAGIQLGRVRPRRA